MHTTTLMQLETNLEANLEGKNADQWWRHDGCDNGELQLMSMGLPFGGMKIFKLKPC